MDGTIVTVDLADSAVTTAKIADLNVTRGKIADNAIDNTKLYENAVLTHYIADLAVTEGKIGPLAVTEGKIGGDAVTSAKIFPDTILPEDIATGAVATDEILNDTIVDADINSAAAIALSKLAKSIKIGTFTLDLASIAGYGAVDNVVPVPGSGLTTSHRIVVTCQSSLDNHLVVGGAWVSLSEEITVKLSNHGTAAVDDASRVWAYFAFIP